MTTIAVAVVLRHGHALVGRRAADAMDAAGLDEFPGGKVEPGDSPARAAARECLEEAGVAVRIDALLDRVASTSASCSSALSTCMPTRSMSVRHSAKGTR